MIPSNIITADEQHAARLSALRDKLVSLLQREAELMANYAGRVALASVAIAIRQCRTEISLADREADTPRLFTGTSNKLPPRAN